MERTKDRRVRSRRLGFHVLLVATVAYWLAFLLDAVTEVPSGATPERLAESVSNG